MSRATIQIEGFVARDPESREVTGHTIVQVVVPVTPQKKNPQTNQWEDAGDTIWYQAQFWDEHGQAILATVAKGMLVTLTGGLEVKQWSAGDKSGVNVNVVFPTIGVVVRKPKRGEQVQQSAQTTEPWAASAPAAEAAGDVWNTPGNYTEETPF